MKTALLSYFILLVLTLNGPLLLSQPVYEARGFSEKDGLCASGLNAIATDDQGFVWMTSENGVSRFDGNSFYCFRHDENDAYSLLANKCDYVYKDHNSNIWIKSLFGLSLFDKASHRFLNFIAEPGIFSGISGGKMAEDNTGRLWLGGYGDVIIFDVSSKQFKKSGWFDFVKKSGIIKQEKRNNAVLEVMRKSEYELYILSVYGLFSVDTRTGQYTHHANPAINDYWAFYLSNIDADGRLWMGTYDQCFYIYNPATNIWVQGNCRELSTPKITDIRPLGHDSLLMLSDKKLLLYRPSLSSFSPLDFELTRNIDESTLGSFWKCWTSAGSLYFLMSGHLPFVQMRKPSKGWSEHSLRLPRGVTNNVAQHTGMGDKIIIGDWNRKEVSIYDLKTGMSSFLTTKSGEKKLGSFQFFYKMSDHTGILVVSDRIYEVNVTNKIASPLMAAQNLYDLQPEFRNVVRDHKNQLFIRERNTGIWIINTKAKRIEPFFSPNAKGNYSDLFFEDATQKFWLSQERNGLYVIESNKLTSKHYPLQIEERGGPSTINSIVGDGKGKVHLALLDHGLMVVEAATMQVKRYSQEQGIPTDIVSFGGVDRNGNYWGTSQGGLFCLQDNKISNFAFHRIGKQFFYRISDDASGHFYQNLFPFTLLSFDPAVLLSELESGTLYLSEVKVEGEKLYDYRNMKLGPHQNSISVIAGCLLYNDWLEPKCEYSLNGSKWQAFDLKSELNFFNLAPDSYILLIRRSDRESKLLDIRFTIFPPWYYNKLYWAFLLVILSGLIYWLYSYRIKKVKNEEEVKSEMAKALAQMEMSALRAQMNPHFIFNCLNSINRFILTNEPDLASDYLTRFSRLIRLVLDNSREEIISLEKELAALNLYLVMEAMRFQEKFNWTIEIQDDIDTSRWPIAPMTLQPYVENAIWHGLLPMENEKGIKILNIIIKSTGFNEITISIDDNGVGRKTAGHAKDDTKKSHGMFITGERLALISKMTGVKTKINIIDKQDAIGNAVGTTINIVLQKNDDPIT
ncbi:MAG: histidine kinase [Saprospiraceae bacterium]|nr:histidine kinase [Saprospiraceae bacterium]